MLKCKWSRVSKLLVLALYFGICIITQAKNPAYIEEIVEKIRNKVVAERSYEMGSEIVITLEMDRAIRLSVNDNEYGLEEILICPMEGIIYHLPVWSNGKISSTGKRLEVLGFCHTYGSAPDLGFVVNWQVSDEQVIIKFRTTTDKKEIERERAKNQQEALERMRQTKRQEKREADRYVLPRLERISGFVRLWSEVKYNFAFFDQVPDLDWDGILDLYLPKVEAAETRDDYYRVLQRCLTQLKDGHTDVSISWPKCQPPLWVESVEGKAIITELLTEKKIEFIEAGLKEELREANLTIGEEITHIDGRSVQEILEQEIYPFISASTAQARDRKAYEKLLKGELDSRVRLRVRKPNGQTWEVFLTRSLYYPQGKPDFEHRSLSEGIKYVALRSFSSDTIVEKFDSVFDRICRGKGLIIDVRDNGGGDTDNGYAIISRLIDRSLKGSCWKTRQYMPAYRAWGRQERWYESSHGEIEPHGEKRWLGPVVVLVGAGTVSAAEDFLVALHAGGRVTLVGGRSAGTTGQPLLVELPGGSYARICTKRDTYPDGRDFVGVGVIPDVEVYPIQADIASGRDAVLEKGLEVLRSKIE